MKFFDCNVSYGKNYEESSLKPVLNIQELKNEMKNAGVQKAMVWRKEQYLGTAPRYGNNMLAEDIKNVENVFGIWSIVPCHTHEIPDPDHMIDEMKKNRIYAWQLFPDRLHFVAKPFTLKVWFELALEHNIPIYMSAGKGLSFEAASGILDKYPEITVILSGSSVWPSDRLLRPFVAEYPNVYLDMTLFITAGGIESFVNEFGKERLLYGSGFPDSYFGSNMLMVKHAEIPTEARIAIAGENMENIIRRVRL